MKLVFMGTAEFGIPSFEEIMVSFEPELVITQPDRPAGRGGRIKKTPIKRKAEELGLKIYQPEDINSQDSIEKIRSIDPDILLLIAYGQILRREVLSLPRIWPVNLHGSLLPEFRGPAPVNWAIIEGEEVSGVTTMIMDEGVDTGDLLLQREMPISKEDNAGNLHDRLANLGSKVVMDTLKKIEGNELTPQPQALKSGSYAPKLDRIDGEIHWGKKNSDIYNMIRGMNPYPGSFTYYQDTRIKVHRVRELDTYDDTFPGRVSEITSKGVIVETGNGALELLEVQPEARKRMSGIDFVNGYHLRKGDKLG